jgi:hypothetical protein
MAAKGWQRKFEEPISLPDGRTLVTLHDAATYVTGLAEKEAALPEWQASGPTMFARIGVMLALNRGLVREFNPDHKEHHWGKRKLRRDQ